MGEGKSKRERGVEEGKSMRERGIGGGTAHVLGGFYRLR